MYIHRNDPETTELNTTYQPKQQGTIQMEAKNRPGDATLAYALLARALRNRS